MKPSEVFFDLVKTQFAPVLRAEGFRGSGRTFRRERSECIHILNIQTRTSGGRCAVNLAVNFTFLYHGDPAKVTEQECDFRRRLSPSAGEADFWWDFGDGAAATQESVSRLIETYRRIGVPFFGRFGEFPGTYAEISVDDLRRPSKDKLPGGTTTVRCALVLARMCLHLKQPMRAKEFLVYGLEVCQPKAAYIRGEMRELVKEIEPSIGGDGKPAPQC